MRLILLLALIFGTVVGSNVPTKAQNRIEVQIGQQRYVSQAYNEGFRVGVKDARENKGYSPYRSHYLRQRDRVDHSYEFEFVRGYRDGYRRAYQDRTYRDQDRNERDRRNKNRGRWPY